MGALIMTHSDDEGLVVPPKLAPIQVVGVPIYRTEEELAQIDAKFQLLAQELKAKGIRFKYDNDDNRRPGWKFAEYETKGVPVRLAMGPRDLENGKIEVARRDTKSKETLDFANVAVAIEALLNDIHEQLLQRAKDFRAANTHTIDSYEQFKIDIEKGGFFLAHWDGTPETEERVKQETKATIRCIPFEPAPEPGFCMVTGKPSAGRVVFAKAY
jgi:prolyl-tRNA synthetase